LEISVTKLCKIDHNTRENAYENELKSDKKSYVKKIQNVFSHNENLSISVSKDKIGKKTL